jgi:hypothetical protein
MSAGIRLCWDHAVLAAIMAARSISADLDDVIRMLSLFFIFGAPGLSGSMMADPARNLY